MLIAKLGGGRGFFPFVLECPVEFYGIKIPLNTEFHKIRIPTELFSTLKFLRRAIPFCVRKGVSSVYLYVPANTSATTVSGTGAVLIEGAINQHVHNTFSTIPLRSGRGESTGYSFQMRLPP